MKTKRFNGKPIALLFAMVVFFCSLQSLSFGQVTLTASAPAPLTEETLHGSVVTFTLSGGGVKFKPLLHTSAVVVSGILGVTVGDIDERTDTEIRVTLKFYGDFDSDTTLRFRIEDRATNHKGGNLTASLPVTAVEESITVTPTLLSEAILNDSTLTLTLQGRTFNENLWEDLIEIAPSSLSHLYCWI